MVYYCLLCPFIPEAARITQSIFYDDFLMNALFLEVRRKTHCQPSSLHSITSNSNVISKSITDPVNTYEVELQVNMYVSHRAPYQYMIEVYTSMHQHNDPRKKKVK